MRGKDREILVQRPAYDSADILLANTVSQTMIHFNLTKTGLLTTLDQENTTIQMMQLQGKRREVGQAIFLFEKGREEEMRILKEQSSLAGQKLEMGVLGKALEERREAVLQYVEKLAAEIDKKSVIVPQVTRLVNNKNTDKEKVWQTWKVRIGQMQS